MDASLTLQKVGRKQTIAVAEADEVVLAVVAAAEAEDGDEAILAVVVVVAAANVATNNRCYNNVLRTLLLIWQQ